MRILIAFALLAGCARLHEVPSRGGPAWRELRSAHFVMWTDADEDDAQKLVQRLEHIRSVVVGVAFPHVAPGGTTIVIALRDRREASMFAPAYRDAFAIRPQDSPLGLAVVVVAADADGDLSVPHQLARAIAATAMPQAPEWFLEGVGTYFETLELQGDNAIVGEIPMLALHHVGRHSLPESGPLFRVDCIEDSECWSTAWVIIAYLANERPQELGHLERLLATMPWRDAWRVVFPELSPQDLDRATRYWLTNGAAARATFTIELQQWDVEEHPLTDADVYAARALLSHRRDDVAAALALDPHHVLARAVEVHTLGEPLPVGVARALASAHPQSWVAWDLFATSLGATAEATMARATACDLARQNPAILLPTYCR